MQYLGFFLSLPMLLHYRKDNFFYHVDILERLDFALNTSAFLNFVNQFDCIGIDC